MRKLIILLFSIKLILSLISCDKTTGPNNQTTVTDIDGNIYKTVKIGDQVWMAENLKVTHYRNGDPIPEVTGNYNWFDCFNGAWCNYNNDAVNGAIYGHLYNWYAVDDDRGIAPEGWHVSTDDEWQILVDYLGGSTVAGGKMKETGTIEVGDGLWYEPNTGATNESGFTGLPGGYRYLVSGDFNYIGFFSYFWSSSGYSITNAWSRKLRYASQGAGKTGINKRNGYSIRCVKDSGSNHPPDKPNNPSPSNNSTLISINTNLSWICTDPDDDPLTYNVYFGISSNPPLVNSGLSETTYHPGALSEETTYTWKIKAYDDHGNFTTSDVWEFTTTSGGTSTVTDIDGNVYQTIKIGDQQWITENLKVTHYRNGDPIPYITDSVTWVELSTGAWCNYNNDIENGSIYGHLYNWYAVSDSRGIAPEGWHVPTDEDWQILEGYLGGIIIAGGKMKESGFEHWASPNIGATNESGFTALPGGYRLVFLNDGFSDIGYSANFWSSSKFGSSLVWYRRLCYTSSGVGRNFDYKTLGYSIRCIKDNDILNLIP